MGLFDSFMSAILGSDTGSTDSKKTSFSVNDDGDARVRNTSVIINHDTGEHDTVWSNTTVDGKTGEANSSEGAHGPNFKP
jgi:hypothetical protein